MLSVRRVARHSLTHFAVALIVSGSWLSGCGDDENGGDGKGNGTGGSGAASGSGGSTNGGSAGRGGSTTGGSGGSNTTGGSAGAPMGGSAGATAGRGGSAGRGMGGEGTGGDGMGGDGMGGEAGTNVGGMGMGGEGGATDAMCATNALTVTELDAIQAHSHLPINGMERMTLLDMINTGMPLERAHSHADVHGRAAHDVAQRRNRRQDRELDERPDEQHAHARVLDRLRTVELDSARRLSLPLAA
jgi:hypothetical protein